MNFLTPWFKNSWLKSPGLKLGLEKSGVEMSFNLGMFLLSYFRRPNIEIISTYFIFYFYIQFIKSILRKLWIINFNIPEIEGVSSPKNVPAYGAARIGAKKRQTLNKTFMIQMTEKLINPCLCLWSLCPFDSSRNYRRSQVYIYFGWIFIAHNYFQFWILSTKEKFDSLKSQITNWFFSGLWVCV